MIIKPIKIADIDIVAQVAAECFADDHFYASLHSDREQRKELLKKLFNRKYPYLYPSWTCLFL